MAELGYKKDFAFLTGHWRVEHRYLSGRLANNSRWLTFHGTCSSWPMMDGQTQVDDYVLAAPDGTRRAMGVRAYDLTARVWSIWWIDSRDGTTAGEPVRGGFADGIGTFFGDDTLNGKPIKVRFIWSGITPTTAHWEQAFSNDGGQTWETNWTMDFRRAPPA